jgi:hypothetical protein
VENVGIDTPIINTKELNLISNEGKQLLADTLTPFFDFDDDYTDEDTKKVLNSEYLKEEAANCKAVSLYETNAADSSGKKNHDTVNIVFLSDIHGSAVNMANCTSIIAALRQNGCTIHDVYFGGDQSTSMFTDGSFNNLWDANVNPAFIFALGNHDTWIPQSDYNPEAGDEYNGFYVKNRTACYNQYYKNRIENWSVIYQEGKNYFYKDYLNIIRIIVLDSIHLSDTDTTSEQYSWLVATLEDARTKGLHVICVEHYSPYAVTKLDSRWTCIDKNYSSTNPAGWDGGGHYFRNAVDDFIYNGGTFIMWLVGHTHCDIVGYFEGANHHNKELVFVTALAANNNRSGDNVCVNGTKSQNCMTYLSFDIDKKLIRMHRIGRNISRYAQRRDYITLDYGTQSIITES